MLFSRPILLILLLPLAFLEWKQSLQTRTLRCLRRTLYLVLVLGAAGLTWKMPSRQGLCVAIADRSLSVPGPVLTAETTILRELERSRPTDSGLAVFSFSSSTIPEQLSGGPPFEEFQGFHQNREASNLAGAIETALAHIPEATPARILLLTDGYWNGLSPQKAIAKAAARGIAVDYRFWERNLANDVAITRLEAPLQIYEGESHTLECEITAPNPCTALLQIRKNNSQWSSRKVNLHPGSNHFTWQDKASQAGTQVYHVQILPENQNDACPENNLGTRLVTVKGRKRILLVSQSPSGNLAQMFRKAGLEVEVRAPNPILFSPAALSAYSCVVLENVPGGRIGYGSMELLATQVQNGALGLVMTGGKSAFANGGYYQSPLEKVLPVSMEQKQEIRKAKVAMMVALDRSGSMSLPVGDQLTKMDLANRATAEVLNLLQPDDEFGVLAVDSESHEVVPFRPLAKATDVRNKILSIESQGGGIFTYTALHDATRELLSSKAQVRHLILFADASDAEEPGEYQGLLQQTFAAGITVSVVGLGTENDSDAEFLKDVALRGGGTCYFTDKPEELPRLFAEDTFQVALKTFIEEPVTGTYLPEAFSLSQSLMGSVTFNGYNLCFLKHNAHQFLVSTDDNQAPLAAAWQFGLGRCAVLTAEADGTYTGPFASAPTAASLLTGLVRWAAAQDAANDSFLVTPSLQNGLLHLELELDPDRAHDPFLQQPMLSTAVWTQGHTQIAPDQYMQWTTPDRLELSLPLQNSAIYLPTLSLGQGKTLSLPPVSLPLSPEYTFQDAPQLALLDWCKASGGRERLRIADTWKRLSAQKRFFDSTPFWAILAILLLLTEVAERRLMLASSLLTALANKAKTFRPVAIPESKEEQNFPPPTPKASKVTKVQPAPKQTYSPAPESQPQNNLSTALKKAHKRD